MKVELPGLLLVPSWDAGMSDYSPIHCTIALTCWFHHFMIFKRDFDIHGATVLFNVFLHLSIISIYFQHKLK